MVSEQMIESYEGMLRLALKYKNRKEALTFWKLLKHQIEELK